MRLLLCGLAFLVWSSAKAEAPHFSYQHSRMWLEAQLKQEMQDQVRSLGLPPVYHSKQGAHKQVVIYSHDRANLADPSRPSDHVTKFVYHPNGMSVAILLGTVVVKKQDHHPKFVSKVLHMDGNQILIDAVSPGVMFTKEWQEQRIAAFENTRENLGDLAIEITDKTIELLLFTWRSYKDLEHIIDTFDKTIDEAIQYQESLNVKIDSERMLYETLGAMIDMAVDQRQSALNEARARLAGALAVDVVMFLPGKVLMPIYALLSKISIKLSGSSVVRVSTAIATRAARVAQKSTSYVSRPIKNIAARLAISSLKNKVVFSAGVLSRFVGGLKLASALERHPRFHAFWIKPFQEHLAIKALTPETRRIFLVNLSVSLSFQFYNQLLKRGVDGFINDIDEVAVDMSVTLIFARLSVNFDIKNDAMSIMQRWYSRQLYQHLANWTDTTIQVTKRAFEGGDGLSEEDWQFLMDRWLANLSYTLTRGPLVGAVQNVQNGEFDSMIRSEMEKASSAQPNKLGQYQAAELIFRFMASMMSQQAYLHYRDDYVYAEQERDQLNQELKQDALLELGRIMELRKSN